MTPLAVCRWREQHNQGLYVCHSPKFVAPPNIVQREFCANCCYTDHDTPPPLPKPLPCVHLGARLQLDMVELLSDSSRGQDKYECALYGQCTLEDSDEDPASGGGSCSSCSDYLGRDLFGPNSIQMRNRADAFLTQISKYPEQLYKGRGVVIAGGGDRFFASLYVSVRALRYLGCRLPIQVWYLGRDKEMPDDRRAILAPYDVECVDADAVRRQHPARNLDGWQLKVFAVLNCPFEELLFLDADCYPCRNPELLFELQDYRALGAIFWPDVMAHDSRLKWQAYGVANPQCPGTVESGQFVLNKRLSWRPLNLAWFYNDHSDYYYRYGFGDKHTFEVAWRRCEQPFVMWDTKAYTAEAAYLHRGPDQFPMFVHRCSDKFRFERHAYTSPQRHALPSYYSSLPLERECWEWMVELAGRIDRVSPKRKVIEQLPHWQKPSPTSARFAVATLYTEDIADLGHRSATILTAFAKQHGYDAIIANSSLDVSRPAAWSKLLLVERYLTNNSRCEWLLWVNAEAVAAQAVRQLESLTDDHVDFLIAENASPSKISTEVFLVRNCPAALDMLRRAYAKVQYVHHAMHELPAVAESLSECFDTLRTLVVPRHLLNLFDTEQKPMSNGEEFIDLLPAHVASEAPWSDLPPIFCITCWQTPERTRLAAKHFAERDLKVQFFPGIHGKSFGLRTSLETNTGYRLMPGEVGCLMSHYMLWQTLAYLPHEEILILEDDAWFQPTFQKQFRLSYRDLPKDWQFVFVGARGLEGRSIERVTRRVGIVRYPTGTHAYLVKRTSLKWLLQSNHQARQPIDLQLMANSLPAMKCYTFIPPLVKQRSAGGVAEGTGENWPTTIRVADGGGNAR